MGTPLCINDQSSATVAPISTPCDRLRWTDLNRPDYSPEALGLTKEKISKKLILDLMKICMYAWCVFLF